jgi:hypothetical protein
LLLDVLPNDIAGFLTLAPAHLHKFLIEADGALIAAGLLLKQGSEKEIGPGSSLSLIKLRQSRGQNI